MTDARLGAATVRNAIDQSRPRPNQRAASRSRPLARGRHAAIAITAPLATAAARKPSVMSPVSGQLRHAQPNDAESDREGRLGASTAAGEVVECRSELGPAGRQLVDAGVAGTRPRRSRSTPMITGPSGRRRASARNGTATIGSSATPRTWHCIVTAVPKAASSHQRRSPPVHARHAPARASALESAMRFGFQMNVDSSIAAADRDGIARPATAPATGPADGTGEPPHDAHGRDPRQRDEGHHGERRVTPGQGGGRAQQVVVPGAVVHVADRGRRPEQRQDTVLDERPEREHVVALVGFPRAARDQVREPHQGGEGEQHGQDVPTGSAEGGAAALDGPARTTLHDRRVAHAGAVRALELPRSWNAPAGRGSSGSPVASARARARLMAS